MMRVHPNDPCACTASAGACKAAIGGAGTARESGPVPRHRFFDPDTGFG